MHEIIPTILTDDFSDFSAQVKKIDGFSQKIQIDVMDGKFVTNKTFAEIKQINNLDTRANFELHLMAHHPLKELTKWLDIKNIFRVIFHWESADDPAEVVRQIQAAGWQAGLAINPDTPWQKAEALFPQISELLFLTVYPGTQGAKFQPKVIKKIKQFSKLPARPLCGADGGINIKNIRELKKSGVEIFNIGSAIIMADNPKEAYQKLKNQLK